MLQCTNVFRTKFLLLLILSVLISVVSILAETRKPEVLFEELKSQFLSLRNTDPDLIRAAEWEDLAQRFKSYVNSKPRDDHAPNCLFNAALLYQEIFNGLGGKDRLEEAVQLFERLAKEYPGHALADDALVKKGDLLLANGERAEAKRSFLEVVDSYPEADMAALAESRLAIIKQGKNIQPTAQPTISMRKTGKLIVIDPGHGGEDQGAVGQGGLLEKDVVLDVALRLEELIKKNLNVAVKLTRRSDIFVPLLDRTNMANANDADLFISLHTNASPQKKLSGMEVFYLDNGDDAASRELAKRENASIQFEGPDADLTFMLSDLIQSAKLEDSIELAHLVQQASLSYISTRHQVKNLGVRKAPFYVLVGAHMPCILVELFFIDNAEDGKRLAEKEFRADLAYGLFLGIKNYLKE